MVAERQGHGAREVLDRTDLFEDLFEARLGRDVLTAGFAGRFDPGLPPLVTEQPVKGLGLQRKEVRDSKRLLDAQKKRGSDRRAPAEALREAANRGPSEGSRRLMRAHAGRSNAEEPPDRGGSTGARTVRAGLGQLRIKPADTRTLHRKRQRAAQKGSVAERLHRCPPVCLAATQRHLAASLLRADSSSPERAFRPVPTE